MTRHGARGPGRPPWTCDNVGAGPSGTSRNQQAGVRGGRRRTSRKASALGRADKAELPDPVMLVRELNHRVKNNLQIIVSLMNLQKRMMPPERREDIRFIEEHVQSMSVAYRLVYATGAMIEVSLSELVTEVLSGLRQIAGVGEELLRLQARVDGALIGLDPAIALALYLAVLLPPYLDKAAATGGTVTVTLTVVSDVLTLSVRGGWSTPVGLELLRGRLMQAYAAQLKAHVEPASDNNGVERIRFMLEKPTRSPETI